MSDDRNPPQANSQPSQRRPRTHSYQLASLETGRYTLDVVALDVAAVACGLGGLIIDRVHGGWTVRVFVDDGKDVHPLRILGAEAHHYDDGISAVTERRAHTALAVSTAALERSDDLRGTILGLLRRGTHEIIVWGNPPAEAQQYVIPVQHTLTSAARAFKALACTKFALDSRALLAEEFHGSGTLCAPGNADLIPRRDASAHYPDEYHCR